MNLITKAFKRPLRPWQIGSVILMGICMHMMLPAEPTSLEWLAYALGFFAYLANGMDNYREGLERGIHIMEKLK
jgi:hypothetical protein